MAGSLNKVMLIGNLARDPEVRSFDNGGKICSFRLITNESWKDRDGNQQERVEGHNVVIHNERLVEVAERYLKKGSKVYLEGKITTRKYQDKDGNDRYSTEIDLPRYNSTLTMLGGGGEEDRAFDSNEGSGNRGGNRNDNRGNDRGNDRGGNRGGYDNDRGNDRGSSNRGGNGGGYRDEMEDDDIPF
jgi:single-strand DNA-binding protein